MLLTLMMQLGMYGSDSHDGGAFVFRKKQKTETPMEASQDIHKIVKEAIYGPLIAPIVVAPAMNNFDDDEESIAMLLAA